MTAPAPKSVTITLTTQPHECGMCGPSGMTVAKLEISDPPFSKTWRQSFCDNSDPLDVEMVLWSALEELGYDVRVDRENDW